ncbi:uncharacterized protein LOC105834969 isoform X2 [Monomorium pharaonis]|uniref:uncharacterized protein LOC105834969 isoform X2 n=1 Tax=Monomorium pharaonis TaxID=307658 RepID=UPI0017462852|nr:uncharacterized protein LOC105834969 isoform X2 [Monomorium pharaonis]
MECNTNKENLNIDVVEKTVMEVEFAVEKSINNDSLVINDNSSVASVIIEELDESAINSMDMDINEFVEARALEIKEVADVIPNYSIFSPSCNSNKDVVDVEDQDTTLTADEEDQLTKQFLNGELTFSEYSSRMDQDIDQETIENDTFRRTIGFDRVAVQKIVEQKSYKASNVRQKKKKRVLSPVLQGFMGEANLRFAKGEVDLAAKMCMEIIRQVPSAPEPYQTLAMIYENDQPEKSLQFALIAAHLSPKDADQWIRLANLSLENGDIKQAITCYSKAIQASPKDISLYETRAQLQEQNGDRKAYLRGYTRLIHQLETEDGEYIMKYAKILAKRYMQEDNNEQALEAVETIFTKCPALITLEEVNIMTELLIALKQFKKCLDILVKYTSIQIRYSKNEEREKEVNANKQTKSEKEEGCSNAKGKATSPLRIQNSYEIESCDVPDDVVVDLKAKFLITLIELNYIPLVEELLPKFYMRENPEISGDLFLDVAEALMGKKEFQRAMVLLDPLVKSSNFSLAAVWLRHAECWVGCNNFDQAIESYETVRKLSPQHLGARLALAKLYKKSEQYDKAIQVLYQDPESDITLDSDVLYQRILLLFKVGRYEEYFSSGMLLFSRHCINIRRKVELNALARATGVRQRLDSLQLRRLSCGEKLEDENAPTFNANEKPSEKNEFLLFLQMCKLAYKLKKYGFLQRLCFTALTSKRFKTRNSHIIFLCLVSCIHNKDSFYGYNIVREFVRVRQRSNTWNLLNIIIQRAEDLRHNRFIMRLLGRDVFSYLHIMHANNCLVSGTYKYALNGYMSLFKVAPGALLALLIGVTQLQMACQKMSAKKNQLVIQALGFFKKYMQLRGKEGQQESYYNLARAFHQIGLLPSAIHFYKLVLKEDSGNLVKQYANLLDLRREAAFNLHLIYLQSENHLLARIIMATDLEAKIEFIQLCETLEGIAKTHKIKKKEQILETFIDKCRNIGNKIKIEYPKSDVSLYPILRLILPHLERQRGPHNLKQTSLAKLYIDVYGFAKNSNNYKKLINYREPMSNELLDMENDFANRAYCVLEKKLPRTGTGFTIARINTFLDGISEKSVMRKKKVETFRVLFCQITGFEMKWVTRIILKDLRLGIKTERILHSFLTAVFMRHLNPNCHSFILDGELIAWHKEKKIFATKGMNLDVKHLSPNSRHQPCFVAFDIILHNNILLVDVPYKNRLKLLSDIFTEEEGLLVVCESTLISNREQLIELFNTCLRNNEEGLVVKNYNMKYKPNVRDGNGCYKIKAEYSDNLVQDLDLIILGGYYGEGKYTGIIKSFMMGVAVPASNEKENPSQFVSVVSVSTGIKDEMLHHLETKLAPYWIKEQPEKIISSKRNQPNVWIYPEHSIILTIRATEMIRSNEYQTGYTLRFPRVVNVRTDKPWYSTCTISELQSLARDEGMIQKLTKREATLYDLDQVPVSKLQKIAGPSKSITCNVYNEQVQLTRILDGKEICVINGNDELPKEQIEEILQQHSAKIVQNPKNTTFCVIVGNDKTIRGKEEVNRRKHDVVTLDWFKRITNLSNGTSLDDFLPWELLCCQDITKHRVAENYDEYYDNFTIDADEESLKRSFGKIKPIIFKNADNQFEKEKQMDQELFRSTSPYSLFRNIIGFFENQSCYAKFKFRFMSGTVKDSIDDSVTHVFVEDEETSTIIKNMKAQLQEQTYTKIIKCKWIEECFQNYRLCEITDYLIDY